MLNQCRLFLWVVTLSNINDVKEHAQQTPQDEPNLRHYATSASISELHAAKSNWQSSATTCSSNDEGGEGCSAIPIWGTSLPSQASVSWSSGAPTTHGPPPNHHLEVHCSPLLVLTSKYDTNDTPNVTPPKFLPTFFKDYASLFKDIAVFLCPQENFAALSNSQSTALSYQQLKFCRTS